MKKGFIFLMVIGGILLLNACQEDEVMRRDENLTCLNFAKASYSSQYDEDSLQFEALYNSNAQIYRLQLPVCLSGKISSEDREYEVRVNEQETSGVTAGKHFELEKKQVFRAGRTIDTVVVEIHVRTLMDEGVQGRLFIEIVPNENFSGGMEDFQYIVIHMSGAGLTTMPDFWTYLNMTDYGGEYMHIKAEKFIELNAIPMPSTKWWRNTNNAIVYAYARKTYEWFENNPTYVDGERVHFKGTVRY